MYLVFNHPRIASRIIIHVRLGEILIAVIVVCLQHNGFYRLGEFNGTYPWRVIGVTTFIVILCGLVSFRLKLRRFKHPRRQSVLRYLDFCLRLTGELKFYLYESNLRLVGNHRGKHTGRFSRITGKQCYPFIWPSIPPNHFSFRRVATGVIIQGLSQLESETRNEKLWVPADTKAQVGCV
eukprot:3408052-Pyramimonas_sp.AAC.2